MITLKRCRYVISWILCVQSLGRFIDHFKRGGESTNRLSRTQTSQRLCRIRRKTRFFCVCIRDKCCMTIAYSFYLYPQVCIDIHRAEELHRRMIWQYLQVLIFKRVCLCFPHGDDAGSWNLQRWQGLFETCLTSAANLAGCQGSKPTHHVCKRASGYNTFQQQTESQDPETAFITKAAYLLLSS